MKRRLLFSAMSIMMLSGILFLVSNVPVEKQYSSRTNSSVKKQDANGYIKWMLARRANPATGSVNVADVEQAREQADATAGSRSLGLSWEEMGPNNVGGRTRAFLIDRNNHNRLFAGGVGGGLWYSTTAGSSWHQIAGGDAMNSLSVASICQGADGYIYFGTGEGLYGNYGDGTGGFQGQGIFKSTQPSTSNYTPDTFVRLDSTWGTAAQRLVFVHVNKMAADPVNAGRIYAATEKGLRVSDDGGTNWYNPLGVVATPAKDVDVASDGTVIASVGNRGYLSANGDNGTYTLLPGSSGLPTSGVLRIEFAIAPSNPNIMYASAIKSADGKILNIYMSTDKGINWTVIGPGGTTAFSPFSIQGDYDNAVGVAADNPYKLFIGGLELWKWDGNSSMSGQWTKIDCWFCWEHSSIYTHADKHVIVFDPVSPNIMYVASDGGIAKSTNQGLTFTTVNKNYNVTQFYSVAIDPSGHVMGGTQDNGTPYITGRSVVTPNDDPQFSLTISGGDGGFTAFSYLYPATFNAALGFTVGAAFAATPNGQVMRSNGGNFGIFYDDNIIGTDPANPVYDGDFVTPFALWESRNDLLTNDAVKFGLPASNAYLKQALIPSISIPLNDGYATTSSTSMSLTAGNHNLTVHNGLLYAASGGQPVLIKNSAANYMTGTVSSYNNSTGAMTVNITSTTGSGTFNNWNVYLNRTHVQGTINYTYNFQNTGNVIPGSVRVTDGIHLVTDIGTGSFTGDVDASQTNTIDYVNRTFDVTFNSLLAVDSTLIVQYQISYPSGIVLNISSNTIGLPISYTTTSPLMPGDTLVIQDIIQSRFVVGLTNPGGSCIWMTKRPIDFSDSKPQWYKIANGLNGIPECMVFSKDGNNLFVGTNSGRVYRISGLSYVTDTINGWCTNASTVVHKFQFSTILPGSVTGIDVSKSNPNKVIATNGGYSTNPINHVFRSTNALSVSPLPSMTSIASVASGLPNMPVYDVLMNKDIDTYIVLGTDLGIYASDNDGVSWTEENAGMGRTAVEMIRQVPGNGTGGMVYAATHGRGIFKTSSLVGINDPQTSTLGSIDSRAIKVFPNPMSGNGFTDYVLNQNSNVNIEMYDIKGTLIKNDKLGKLSTGLHRYSFDAGNLNNGTYFIVVRAGSEKATGRFVIVR